MIESIHYAYRATGNRKYQEWAWEAFVAVNKTCFVPDGSGYSSIRDVDAQGGGNFTNFQESFWFAEVLKYSYLIHAEVGLLACLLPSAHLVDGKLTMCSLGRPMAGAG